MQEDTIDLRDLLKTLKKRKKMILLISLLFVILTVAYLMIAKPVYQVQAMIEVGKLGEKPLADIQDIKYKLEHIYGVKSKKEMGLPRVKAISIAKKTKSVFFVTAEGYTNEEATQFIESIVQKVEKAYKAHSDTYINTQKELIKLAQEDVGVAEENLKKLQLTLEGYNEKMINITTADAALAGIYTIQIGQNQTQAQALQAHISALKTKVYNLELSISPLKIKPTQLVGNVEVLDKPIKPKKALSVIVSFITGLLLAVFLAFFLEFAGKLKEEDNIKGN